MEKDTQIKIESETLSGRLTFAVSGDRAGLMGYEGKDMHVEVPARITVPADMREKNSAGGSQTDRRYADERGNTEQNQYSAVVTEIAPKAFFNIRTLTSVTLPSTIERIGDWAFSHCPLLKQIQMSEGKCELGRGLFDEDRSLRRIILEEADVLRAAEKPYGRTETRGNPPEDFRLIDVNSYGALLAAAATTLEAPYLVSSSRENDSEWLKLWDQRLSAILDLDDMEGFTELVLCGEEDYGSRENNPKEFLQKKRWRKVRLCFLRLLHDEMLADANKIRLQNYLREHTKGCESEETWLFLKKERADDIEYLDLFTDLGCVDENNFDACIRDLNEQQPQMRAYLLRWQKQHLTERDFFAALSLD